MINDPWNATSFFVVETDCENFLDNIASKGYRLMMPSDTCIWFRPDNISASIDMDVRE
jgi:hypothetical protein